jgi:hypothetical protein
VKWAFKGGVTCHTLPFKKKVRVVCELPGADIQKPYTSKYGQGKTKINLFRDFLQKSQCPSYEFYSS